MCGVVSMRTRAILSYQLPVPKANNKNIHKHKPLRCLQCVCVCLFIEYDNGYMHFSYTNIIFSHATTFTYGLALYLTYIIVIIISCCTNTLVGSILNDRMHTIRMCTLIYLPSLYLYTMSCIIRFACIAYSCVICCSRDARISFFHASSPYRPLRVIEVKIIFQYDCMLYL